MLNRGALGFMGTLSSMGAATGMVLTLAPSDRISIKFGSALTGLGFVFFVSLFDFLNHIALKTTKGIRFRKKYHLSMSDVLDISNKLVSAVQAALSCLTGMIVCLWSCTRSLLHASHFMSEAYAWFGAAYFFYDIWSMYKVHASETIEKMSGKLKAMNGHNNNQRNDKIKNRSHDNNRNNFNKNVKTNCKETKSHGAGDNAVFNNELINNVNGGEEIAIPNPTFTNYLIGQPIIVMHHLFIGSFGFLVIVYLRGGLGDCVFGFVYLMELSTPFVSLRGILSKLGLKSSRLYVINGLLMLGTFFFCRVAMFPYVCYMYSQVIGLPYFQAIWSLPTGCKISISILMLPQLYWFWLMVKGAFKVFFVTGKPAQEVMKSVSAQAKKKRYKKFT